MDMAKGGDGEMEDTNGMPDLGINIRNTDFEKLMLVIMKLAEFSQSHKKFEAVVACDLENKKISLKFYEQT